MSAIVCGSSPAASASRLCAPHSWCDVQWRPQTRMASSVSCGSSVVSKRSSSPSLCARRASSGLRNQAIIGAGTLPRGAGDDLGRDRGLLGGHCRPSAGMEASSLDMARDCRQPRPRIARASGGRRDLGAEFADDPRGALDEGRVSGRQLARGEIKIILETDADMSAEDHRLRHHREVRGADAEGAPVGARPAPSASSPASPRWLPAPPMERRGRTETAGSGEQPFL